MSTIKHVQKFQELSSVPSKMERVDSAAENKPKTYAKVETASKTPDKCSNKMGNWDSRPALKEKATNLPPNPTETKPKETNRSQTLLQNFQAPSKDKILDQTELAKLLDSGAENHIKIEEPAVSSVALHPQTPVIGEKRSPTRSCGSPIAKRAQFNISHDETGPVVSPNLNLLPLNTTVGNDNDSDFDVTDLKDPPSPLQCASPLKPDPYQPLLLDLHESDLETESQSYYDEVFREVKDESERAALVEFAKMDIRTWTASGDKLQQEQHAVLVRLVEARMRLSAKFKVITDLVNERALALTDQGLLLDRKLKRIQDLGKEILDIL
ncbi:Ecm11p LALA0_S09e00232g [Lachancea lanzarotensis]|uniref:LALA0S09e00232g1_1 n=1 Tax=Lachancea lanzarotensis TaxID=1245769 RepID=A0A0C7MUY5_9SACH|nr:uncharacterized protein LALA0_S09e00232g [Lachancea lanzarotensis]CEP63686.1 LALA0S09e00232g1_1 [Lachancea lanzarotensis]